MSRARLARTALQAFPASVRAAQGEEMLGTVLDVSGTSRGRFALELIGLVRSGMQARATQTAHSGARRVVADGTCLAAVWLLTLFLASDLGERIRGQIPGYETYLLSAWSLALVGAALALALIGYDRLAGGAALLFLASLVADHPAWHDLTNSRREQLLIIPAICFGVLLLAPRRRKPDARRLAWLALTAALAVTSGLSDDPAAAILILALLLLVPLALVLLRTDPRLAIACALPATSFGIHMAQDQGGPGLLGVLFLSATPLILTIAVTRTRHLQARTPI